MTLPFETFDMGDRSVVVNGPRTARCHCGNRHPKESWQMSVAITYKKTYYNGTIEDILKDIYKHIKSNVEN